MQGTLGFYIYNKHTKIVGRKFAILTPRHAELESNWRAYASNYLKIGYVPKDQPVLGIKPPVPFFQSKTLTGKMVTIRELYKTKPVVIVIFSPRCKFCRKELGFLNSIYNDGDLKGKFEIVAISLMDKKCTAQWIAEKKYEFPIIIDTEGRITSLFPTFLGQIPISFVVDQQGLINAVYTEYNSYSDDIYLMQLRKLVSLPNPPLLLKNEFSGEQRCKICHEKEHIQWSLTKHSDSFLSLIRKGKDNDENCISCHVTGFDAQGGYNIKEKKRSRYLKNVQCESCHSKNTNNNHQTTNKFQMTMAKFQANR
jgi:peroxiredoxin